MEISVSLALSSSNFTYITTLFVCSLLNRRGEIGVQIAVQLVQFSLFPNTRDKDRYTYKYAA